VENSRSAFAWLLVLAVPVFFAFLGTNSIWDTNEAFYVETPRQMVRSDDYVNPSFNAAPRFNKPVLSYWIVAGLYRAFGESVAVQRVGIAFGALAIIASAFLIGRALRSTTTGLLAALIVATAPRVVWFSRRIFIDVYLTAFTSLALAAFVLSQASQRHKKRYLALMYLALGLGVLTKGPVALALPALICLIWLAVQGRLRDVRELMLFRGAWIIAGVVLPWYAMVYAQHGWSYITTFVFEENFQRYATTAMTPGDRNVTFYIPVLLTELFPWSLLVVAPLLGIGMAWRSRLRGRGAAGNVASLETLLWLWIVVFVAVFSLSRTKEDLYIFPIVPAVAVLVAAALTDSFGGAGARSRLLHILMAISASLCVIAAPVIYWLFGPSAGYYALPESLPFAIVLGGTGLATLALLLTQRRYAAVLCLAGGFVLANYVFVGWVLRGVERTKPVPPLARAIAERAVPDAKIGYFHMGLQSFVYYTDRGGVEEIGMLDHAEAFFRNPREAWALMGAEQWRQIQTRMSDVCIADTRRLSIFEAKLGDIVRRIPPQEVLLVKNHCN
jgi:4-amino-4-deoxy-L-arabinose transferase-like glycosyltransferase